MMMPPLGCSAVPLPKKKLTIGSGGAASTPSGDRVGITATAVEGLTFSVDVFATGVAARMAVICVRAALTFALACNDFDRGFDRVVDAFPVDFAAPDELLDADGPLAPPELPVSAEAVAGIAAMAAPTPNAMADAPTQVTQVNSTARADGASSAVVRRQNDAAVRSRSAADSNASVEFIYTTPWIRKCRLTQASTPQQTGE